METKKEGAAQATPPLYWERPKERPVLGGRYRLRPGHPQMGRARDNPRRASGPGQSSGNGGCKTAARANPSAPDLASCVHKSGSVPYSSETQVADLELFPPVLDFAVSALPFALGVSADFADSAGEDDLASSALAALLYDSLR